MSTLGGLAMALEEFSRPARSCEDDWEREKLADALMECSRQLRVMENNPTRDSGTACVNENGTV